MTRSRRTAAGFAYPDGCCSVVELRQYSLQPSRRDELIELFDRDFVESQENVSMHVVGQFRDLDDPDRFVWIRGFTDMPSRASALGAFYGGPIRRARRAAANATMAESDNVVLLRPAFGMAGLAHPPPPRPSPRHVTEPAATIVATIHTMAEPATTADIEAFAVRADTVAAAYGVCSLACQMTEPAENTFPALPVFQRRSHRRDRDAPVRSAGAATLVVRRQRGE